MEWMLLALGSALFLGIYDGCKKHAVGGNAVLPVLFWAQVVSAGIWLPWYLLSRWAPGAVPVEWLRVDPLDGLGHLRLMGKSALVGTSWILAYFGLKNLPLSLVSPIRATSPVWTLVGAVILLGERFSALQYGGIAVTVLGFFIVSVAGRREGIRFERNRWVFLIVGATLLGAMSALYDKYLLNVVGYRTPTVQAWFSFYLVVFFAPFYLGWRRRWWPRGEFTWRWSIPMIGVFLLIADFLYFRALEMEGVLIAVVSSLRRGSALVSFVGGLWFFGEVNGWRKLPGLLCILAGMMLLIWAGR